MPDNWIQIKGDPSIRKFLFEQERTFNEFDRHIDAVLDKVATLIKNHGVFHAKIHFSSGQVTLWFVDDPLRYKVYVKDDFLSLDVTTLCGRENYPEQALLGAGVIQPVFEGFKQMRTRDPQVYLRSGSLNIVNGLVGLNFSCDGSHYMACEEFLIKIEEIM